MRRLVFVEAVKGEDSLDLASGDAALTELYIDD